MKRDPEYFAKEKHYGQSIGSGGSSRGLTKKRTQQIVLSKARDSMRRKERKKRIKRKERIERKDMSGVGLVGFS